jgi:hypothetical protein
MPISLYDAFVPSCRQIVGSTLALIQKAEKHCAETGCGPEEIAGASLHPTMLPLGFQIKSVAQHSAGAIEGVRAGKFNPMGGEMPTDFAGMKAMLEKAEAGLAAVTADEMETFIGKDMLFEMRKASSSPSRSPTSISMRPPPTTSCAPKASASASATSWAHSE